MSSSDMAYSITSLLEHPIRSSKDTENNSNQTQAASIVNGVHECLFDNFWQAYDALDLKQTNMHLLMKGIELAKEMQMAIVRVGVSLIEKKEIKKGVSFRYCILENSYLKDITLF